MTVSQIETDAIESIAKALSEEIDRDIVNNMIAATLTDRGWTKTPPTANPNASSDVAAWVHINATGDYRYVGGCWYFEKACDATAFVLKCC